MKQVVFPVLFLLLFHSLSFSQALARILKRAGALIKTELSSILKDTGTALKFVQTRTKDGAFIISATAYPIMEPFGG